MELSAESIAFVTLPAPMVVAFPDEVTSPVRLAFVVTLPAVSPDAVPVIFVPTNAEGVPRAGVIRVAEVTKTTAPLPEDPSERSATAGCALAGTPLVEIEVKKL